MKRMWLLVVLALTGMVATAQPGGGQRNPEAMKQRMEQFRKQRNADLKLKLELSDAVAAKVDSVNGKYDAQQDEMRANRSSGSDREARRAEMQKMEAARQAEVKLLLSAEQQTKYDAWVKEQAAQQRQRYGGGRQR